MGLRRKKEGVTKKLLYEPQREDNTQHRQWQSNLLNLRMGASELCDVCQSWNKYLESVKRYVTVPPPVSRHVQRDSTRIIRADGLVTWWWLVAQNTVNPACYSNICNGWEGPKELALYAVACPASGYPFKDHYNSVFFFFCFFCTNPNPLSVPLPRLFHVKASAGFSLL